MTRPRGTCGLIALGTCLAITGAVHAGSVSFSQSYSNGTQAATAVFTFHDSGPSTTLDIRLINNMTVTGSGTNPQWLQGVFFDLLNSPTMNYIGLGGTSGDDYNDMVTGTPGSTPHSPDTWSPYTDVTADHFWALDQNLSGSLPFGNQQYGLGAAGFGVFGPGDILNYQAGGPHPQPGGSDGGILSGDLIDNGTLNLPNGHTTREFVDGGLWLMFDLGNYDINSAGVSGVTFVFGTGFDEVVLVPLPMAMPVGLAGLALVAGARRRIRRQAA